MTESAQTPGTNHPRLIVTDALGRRIVPIDKDVFSLGRRSESDLRLPGADISRLHAEIVRTGDVCVLHDRQSTFGSFQTQASGLKPRRGSSSMNGRSSGW